LPTEKAMLFVTDGGKAIRTVICETWGELALHQRCRNHKLENITSHLPERERTFIARKVLAAWAMEDAEGAERELRGIAAHLESAHPGAAASVLEGLEETLTVTRLGLPPSLLRTFKTTNPIESMISITRDATRNVKRWRDGKMALRWIAAGMLEAERQFRRVDGYRDLHVLKRALERHQEVIEGRKRVA
jgi:transposase-like protein